MKSIVIVLVLVPLYVFAQDAKMPVEAQRVINKMDVATETARLVYDATVARAKAQAVKDLTPIQLAETRKGNLDGAMLVKAKLEELASDTYQPTDGLPKRIDPRILNLVGKYKVTVPGGSFMATWEIKDDATCVRLESPSYFAKVTINEDNKVVIAWDFETNTLRLPTKRGVMEGFCSIRKDKSGGNPMRFEKIDQ